ncbi:MAG: glutathione S-transferase [Myxococcales bacterium]|nr:glutathione S-transferase [Myxococcales bacterium]
MSRPRLITIPFSHYCEKARWALERCGVEFEEDGHPPLLHWIAVRRAGGRRTVPILVTPGGPTLCESADIVRWADRQAPAGRGLYPRERAARTDIDALIEIFDNKLGPATRRWGYGQLLGRPGDMRRLLTRDVPRLEARAASLGVRPISSVIRRAMRIDAAGVQRSLARIESVFSLVGERLADGRPFLTGDAFTAADLTFASLAAPSILPAPYDARFPPLDQFPPAAAQQIERWRETPAGQLTLRAYAERGARA